MRNIIEHLQRVQVQHKGHKLRIFEVGCPIVRRIVDAVEKLLC